MKSNENLTFESALSRLEEIVHTLEEGNTPLSDSLTVFEEGIRLVKFCNESLDKAEQTVKILLKGEDGTVKEDPFSVNA